MTACILALVAFACAWFAVFLADIDRPWCWVDRIPWLYPTVCVLGIGCFEVLMAQAVGAGGVPLLVVGDVMVALALALGGLGLLLTGPETRARAAMGSVSAVLVVVGMPAVLAAFAWLLAT